MGCKFPSTHGEPSQYVRLLENEPVMFSVDNYDPQKKIEKNSKN